MSDHERLDMARRMNWARRYRPSQMQNIRDDDQDDAAARWLARHDLVNKVDSGGGKASKSNGASVNKVATGGTDAARTVVWGPWREFERNGLRGWERSGRRVR
jgi:hypothetical protein